MTNTLNEGIRNPKTALSIDVDKDAALYFDYVVPLIPPHRYTEDSLIVDKRYIYSTPFQDILPPNLLPNFGDSYRDLESNMFRMQFCCLVGKTDVIKNFIDNNKLREADVLYHGRDMKRNAEMDINDPSMLITLAGLRFVDTSNATWQQIIEFRQDSESKKKLRKLRLFLTENYRDKGKAFIEDDLMRRLDEYDDVVKDWGFDTLTSCLSLILSSKHLLTAGIATVLSAFFGEPILTASTAIGGISIEVAKISLELTKRGKELSKLQRDHPMSYIIHAKERLIDN